MSTTTLGETTPPGIETPGDREEAVTDGAGANGSPVGEITAQPATTAMHTTTAKRRPMLSIRGSNLPGDCRFDHLEELGFVYIQVRPP
jgi:hypothetical protein